MHDVKESAVAAKAVRWSDVRGAPLLILSVCLLGWTFSNLDQSLFGFVIPAMREEFGASLDEVGWILSASFAFAALCTTVIGAASDRYGRKALFIVTLGGSSLFVALQGLAPGIAVMGVLRVLAFGFSNGLSPVTMSYVVEVAPPRLRGIMMGLLQCGYPLGWLLGSRIAVGMLENFGWRAVFFPAILVTLATFLLARRLPESQAFLDMRKRDTSADKPVFHGILLLFRGSLRRRTIVSIIFFFMFGSAYSSTAFFFPTFFVEVRGYSMIDATTLVGLSFGIAAIGYIGSALVGEFVLSRRITASIWLALGAMSMAALIWLPRSYNQDLLCFALMGCFFYGTLGCVSTLFGEIYPTQVRAISSAVANNLPMYAGFALFPSIVPILVSHIGWQWTFTLCAVPTLLCASLVLLALPPHASGQALEAGGAHP